MNGGFGVLGALVLAAGQARWQNCERAIRDVGARALAVITAFFGRISGPLAALGISVQALAAIGLAFALCFLFCGDRIRRVGAGGQSAFFFAVAAAVAANAWIPATMDARLVPLIRTFSIGIPAAGAWLLFRRFPRVGLAISHGVLAGLLLFRQGGAGVVSALVGILLLLFDLIRPRNGTLISGALLWGAIGGWLLFSSEAGLFHPDLLALAGIPVSPAFLSGLLLAGVAIPVRIAWRDASESL